MKKSLLFFILLPLSFMGCSSNSHVVKSSCEGDKTSLDGTCVSQEIANYVSCVRSQSLELDTRRSNAINTEIGYLGVGLEGASEFSEKLTKKYSASDSIMKEIIVRCDKLAGIVTEKTAPSKDSDIVVISATYGANCGVQKGNVTNHLGSECEGKNNCYYTVHHKTIGDPAYGCAKNYEALYSCGENGSKKSVFAKAEAGYGSVVNLSCINNG